MRHAHFRRRGYRYMRDPLAFAAVMDTALEAVLDAVDCARDAALDAIDHAQRSAERYTQHADDAVGGYTRSHGEWEDRTC